MNRINLYIQLAVFHIVALMFYLPGKAQVVTGIVHNAESNKPVPFSNILLQNSTIGVSADGQGKFEIGIPRGKVFPKLIVSALGYTNDTLDINPMNNFYEILLKPSQGILNEVVVTGVSKATIIRENPVAIVSVTAKAIEQTVESNIIDVLVKNVPGLNAVKSGPNISKPFIRGLGYNRVLILYDGIRQEGQQWGDEHGIEVDAYNIVRAEVIKGPASIMYGSDAVAGVVSMMPAMPSDTEDGLQGKYFAESQSNNGLLGNGIRLAYTKKQWGYAVRGSYRIAKNYINSVDGRVYNTGFREGNVSGTVQRLTNRGYSNLNFTVYDNLQGIPDGSRDSLTRKFTKQIYEGDDDDIKGRPAVTNAWLNSYQLSPLHQHIQHFRIYTNNHYQSGGSDIDVSLAFQQNHRREYSHPTVPGQAGMNVQLNTYNYAFRYNAPTFLNTEISAGVNGMYQNNKSKNATDFPIPDYSLFDAGGYLFVKWKQNKWTISGGVRYDVRHLNGNDFYTQTDPTTGYSKRVYDSDTASAYLQFPSFVKIFNGTSLGLGTTWQITADINLKANIARGYRAPGITELTSNGLDPGAHIIYLGNRNFIPEFSFQEDIGADFRFKDLSASVSVFNNNIENYIYLSQLTDQSGNAVVDAQGNKTFQYKQAAAQLYGLESNLNIHPASFQGFSFDNAFSMVYGFNRNKSFKSQELNGEYLPLIPPMKILSALSRNFQTRTSVMSDLNVKIELECSAAQNRYLRLNNTETATPAYVLCNVSMNAKIHFSKKNSLQLQLQANNILDKAYQSNLSRLKYFEYYRESSGGKKGIYNMGRNISVKTSIPF